MAEMKTICKVFLRHRLTPLDGAWTLNGFHMIMIITAMFFQSKYDGKYI